MNDLQQDSLASLSLSIAEQLKITAGDCPICELINDFCFSWEKEIEEKVALQKQSKQFKRLIAL